MTYWLLRATLYGPLLSPIWQRRKPHHGRAIQTCASVVSRLKQRLVSQKHHPGLLPPHRGSPVPTADQVPTPAGQQGSREQVVARSLSPCNCSQPLLQAVHCFPLRAINAYALIPTPSPRGWHNGGGHGTGEETAQTGDGLPLGLQS